MASIITLLTDFGLSDSYVGMMKGVILKTNPNATIIDLTHDINPQNIEQAAFVIKTSYSYFPENTIHVVVVDPGVGTTRKIVALKNNRNHIFLAPDNGVLTFVLNECRINTAVEIINSNFFLKHISNTFHGRDIFAPVAGHVSKTGNLLQAGRPIDLSTLKRLNIHPPEIHESGPLVGRVIYIDRFGNLITNIEKKMLLKVISPNKYKKIIIDFNGKKINGISKTYADSDINAPLVIIGSNDFLEIAVNRGRANDFFNASPGNKVKVYLT